MVAVYELGIHWECRQIIVGEGGEGQLGWVTVTGAGRSKDAVAGSSLGQRQWEYWECWRASRRYSLVFVTDVTDRPEQGPAVCCETSAEWGIMNL